MAIPKNISNEHIEKAIEEIKQSKIPLERMSYTYYLKTGDTILPPKYVISVANKFANNEELNSELFNAVEAKNFLIKMGFDIIEKNEINNDVMKPEEIKKLFREWLENNKPGSANAYFSNLSNRVEKLALKNNLIKTTIFEVYTPKEVKFIFEELSKSDEFFSNNNGYSNALNKYLEFCIDLNKKRETGLTSYYVLGAVWDGDDDQSERFINDGIWENGYQDRLLDIVKGVKIGDKVAIKSSFATRDRKSILRVKAIGTITDNLGDGRTLKIKWDNEFSPFDLEGYGGYRNTIQKVAEDDIDAIFNHSDKSVLIKAINNMKHPLNIILYGPPGTGKTYNSMDKAVEIVNGTSSALHSENKKQFDNLRKEGRIEFVTFHQNYSYEDFMVGLKPDVDNEQLRFRTHKGIFYETAKRARDYYYANIQGTNLARSFDDVLNEILKPFVEEGKEVEIKMASGIVYKINDVSEYSIHFKKAKGDSLHTLSIQTLEDIIDGKRKSPRGLDPYYDPLINKIKEMMKPKGVTEKKELERFVLVIDEINRANISKVFGELITLLEDDKRLGEDNELKITLPNGEKDFGVPPNLYIIGTMNTADKSIALIDIALRRRFEFIGYYPTDEVLSKLVSDGILSGDKSDLLRIINKNIYKERNQSADYLIGHAYFINDKHVKEILNNKVIPLLMEYFSGKKETVSKIFTDTNWKVAYNATTYIWDVEPK